MSEVSIIADSLADLFLARVPSVDFRVASSRDEKMAAYRLRFSVIIEKGWGRPEEFPEGLERDEYDERALHIGAWRDGSLVATCRLVLPEFNRALPTAAAFGLDDLEASTWCDVGRFCIAPHHRQFDHRLFLGLLAFTWREMRKRGFEVALTTLTPAVARLYVRWGLEVAPLAKAETNWGEQRFPALIRPTLKLQNLFEISEQT